MTLYELTDEISAVAGELESALEWEPDTDADGNPIDDGGNVIENVDAFRAELLEAWKNTLDGISGEFDEKAANIAAYIKNLKSDCEQLEKEEKALKRRRKVKEKALANITEYLLDQMKQAGKTKIESLKSVISVRTNPESVIIADEKKFIEWAQEHDDSLLRYLQPEIRKSAVKAEIKAGEKIPGAALTRTESLIVR